MNKILKLSAVVALAATSTVSVSGIALNAQTTTPPPVTDNSANETTQNPNPNDGSENKDDEELKGLKDKVAAAQKLANEAQEAANNAKTALDDANTAVVAAKKALEDAKDEDKAAAQKTLNDAEVKAKEATENKAKTDATLTAALNDLQLAKTALTDYEKKLAEKTGENEKENKGKEEQAKNMQEQINALFADSNLAQAMLAQLEKKTDDPVMEKDALLAELAKIETIDLSKKAISKVDGLENLTNLKELKLNDNNLTQVAPLAKLVNLETVDLSTNKINDISPVTHAKSITANNQTLVAPAYIYQGNAPKNDIPIALTPLLALDKLNLREAVTLEVIVSKAFAEKIEMEKEIKDFSNVTPIFVGVPRKVRKIDYTFELKTKQFALAPKQKISFTGKVAQPVRSELDPENEPESTENVTPNGSSNGSSHKATTATGKKLASTGAPVLESMLIGGSVAGGSLGVLATKARKFMKTKKK